MEVRRTLPDPAAIRSGPVALRLWPLAAVAAAVTGLALAGVLPRWPGLVHLVALPPLDLSADLRLLLVRAGSVPAFGALALLVFAVRVVVLATLLGGPTRRRLRFAALFYLAVTPLLLLAAQLSYIAQAVLYSRLFWPALGLLAAVVLLTAAVPWQRMDRLRDAIPASWRAGLRVTVVVPYALVVIVLGVLADVGGEWVTVALVPVSALATALTVHALSREPAGRPRLRLAAAAALLLLAGVVFVGTRGTEPGAPAAQTRAGSILIMSGINSSSGRGAIFGTDTERLGYPCAQVYYFSYAGPGDGAEQGNATCPIRTGAPYVPADTQRPVAEQVDAFVAQAADLPRPLAVAGHSHAVWIAWEAIASGRAEVDVLVLVGPFPQSPIGYLAPGQGGPGRVASDLLRLLVPLADLVDFEFAPDSPGAHELLASANGGGAVFDRSLPAGVRTLSLTSATDLPLMPDGWRLPVERNACPLRVAHPYLPDDPAFYREVNRFLDGAPPLDCPPWRDWGAPMSRPFGVPPDERVTVG